MVGDEDGGGGSDVPQISTPDIPTFDLVNPFDDVGEAVAFLGEALRSLLLREPTASVALIARFPQQADLYHEALRIAEVSRRGLFFRSAKDAKESNDMMDEPGDSTLL